MYAVYPVGQSAKSWITYAQLLNTSTIRRYAEGLAADGMTVPGEATDKADEDKAKVEADDFAAQMNKRVGKYLDGYYKVPAPRY